MPLEPSEVLFKTPMLFINAGHNLNYVLLLLRLLLLAKNKRAAG